MKKEDSEDGAEDLISGFPSISQEKLALVQLATLFYQSISAFYINWACVVKPFPTRASKIQHWQKQPQAHHVFPSRSRLQPRYTISDATRYF